MTSWVAVYRGTTEVMKKLIARENPPGRLVSAGDAGRDQKLKARV